MHARVLALYRQFLRMARDHPTRPYDDCARAIKAGFVRNAGAASPEELTKALAYGRYQLRELEALIQLYKYRTLKRRYYDDPPP